MELDTQVYTAGSGWRNFSLSFGENFFWKLTMIANGDRQLDDSPHIVLQSVLRGFISTVTENEVIFIISLSAFKFFLQGRLPFSLVMSLNDAPSVSERWP